MINIVLKFIEIYCVNVKIKVWLMTTVISLTFLLYDQHFQASDKKVRRWRVEGTGCLNENITHTTFVHKR